VKGAPEVLRQMKRTYNLAALIVPILLAVGVLLVLEITKASAGSVVAWVVGGIVLLAAIFGIWRKKV